jgi:hypothetical protein
MGLRPAVILAANPLHQPTFSSFLSPGSYAVLSTASRGYLACAGSGPGERRLQHAELSEMSNTVGAADAR